MNIRIGHGFDVHAFGDGDHVMLGGVRVPHVRGIVAGTLEGVAHRRGEDRAIGMRCGGINQLGDVLRAQVRARGVVHQQQFLFTGFRRQCLQGGQHRIRAFAAADAGHDRLAMQCRPARPQRVARGQRDHRAIDLRMRQQRLECMRDQRLAGGLQVLLGHAAAEAATAAGGRHQRPGHCGRAVAGGAGGGLPSSITR